MTDQPFKLDIPNFDQLAPKLRALIQEELPKLVANDPSRAPAPGAPAAPAAGAPEAPAAGAPEAPVAPPAPAPAGDAIGALESDAAATPVLPPSMSAPAGAFGDDFEAILQMVFRNENRGKTTFTNDSRDPGGATNYGITEGMLSDVLGRKATVEEVAAITADIARWIYHKQVWTPIRGDELPKDIAPQVFDAAVNNGVTAAGKLVQRAVAAVLGAKITVDGKIGGETIGALLKLDPAQVDELLVELWTNRVTLYTRLKTFQIFGKGWLRRVGRAALLCGRIAIKLRYGI